MARIVVTGGAGFLGSHLCEALLDRGDEVVCVDNRSTSDGGNVAELGSRTGYVFVDADISTGLVIDGHVDAVAHLASPASPYDYSRLPLETLAASSHGTESCLAVVEATGARFVLASTSEVYGDPLVHPQLEVYAGNVDPVGPRSVYHEAKRFAETLTMAHVRSRGADAGIVRIFNTYGPRLRPGDGRVLSNFVVQALTGRPITIYGSGSQTRSFCYVDDLIGGLLAMIDAKGVSGPINLGNPEELSIGELAGRVLAATRSSSEVSHLPAAAGDPSRRRPDITLARDILGWAPTVPLDEGLPQMVAWFRERLAILQG
jgi:dTDP-glucose 4,6-dehydratase